MSEYVAHWRPQMDGSPKASNNCGCCSTGMACDRARKGVKPATAAPWLPPITRQADGTGWNSVLPTMSSAIRKWINANIPESVGVWGTKLSWNVRAAKALYNVTLGYTWAVAWTTFISYVVDHRGCAVAIQYSVMHGTPYDACRSFDGRHIVYVNERRWNATLGRYEFLVMDPLADHRYVWLPQGPQWWPATLLRKAMEAATIEFSYTAATA